VPNDVADAIVERCDGVPLFLEELTKVILEEAVKAAGATLHASLLARLDRLGPDAKEVRRSEPQSAGSSLSNCWLDRLRRVSQNWEPRLPRS